MLRTVKYLSIGVFIGFLAVALLLTGILLPPALAEALPTDTFTANPTSTHTPFPAGSSPVSTFTSTPTFIRPTSTGTPSITPTITPTLPSPTPTLSSTVLGLFESGYLSLAGPLSLEQQVHIYEASLNYIRTTTEESRILGDQINGDGYGAPSDICGPLSIAILQDAGLISKDISPHRFWLLNPDILDDRRLLAKAFPTDRFENKRYKIKLNQVDWSKTPLFPGDFVYIYSGTGGNFEHMLVVSRTDANGLTYAVTNHWTKEGFLISEILLYDPSTPESGIFSSWTARPNAEIGSTGFAGFEIWRSQTQ